MINLESHLVSTATAMTMPIKYLYFNIVIRTEFSLNLNFRTLFVANRFFLQQRCSVFWSGPVTRTLWIGSYFIGAFLRSHWKRYFCIFHLLFSFFISVFQYILPWAPSSLTSAPSFIARV
ncbi:hypothetical protein XENTR_v10006470 [Xenopus tropicalis]|nr:hypothetical protein XENTR_v10006470 [Xenopus tropicalis]